MKFAFRTACVVALTYIYLHLIYLSDWVDEARKSPAGQKAYYFAANLFNVQNADDGETLLLWAYFAIALAAACLTVWVAYRFVVLPVRARQRKTP